MNKHIANAILAPFLLVFASFTGNVDDAYDFTPPYPPPVVTYEDFLRDAYNFKVKNNMPVDDYFYDALGIDNPNTPAWAKHPAVTPPPVPTLRDSVPLWIRKGQLMKESSSYYNEDGTIKYVNKKRGGNNSRKGAIGPFQVLRIAFDHMKKEHPATLKFRRYEEMQTDTKLNEEVACMYLLYIYNGRANKNWNTAIMMYNAGPWGEIDADARNYLKKVKQYGNATP
jgi:hypothetical protein